MRFLATMFLMLIAVSSFAMAGTVRGIATDAESGDPLIGANVTLEGTIIGSTTDIDGVFFLKDVPEGTYTLVVSYLGYTQQRYQVTVGSASSEVSVKAELDAVALVGKAVEVVSSRARDRETPVAFTNIAKAQIKNNLGSRDLPMVVNTSPSVYATPSGGGAGDARINVRGFNQRNIAIMLNGVPVNDMENGWVYWSNWDGVGDATSSIQMQRGLSAVNLATPSIGGTMNILTDPTANERGGFAKQEFGNDGFLKSTVGLHTGLIDGKYAVSAVAVRKIGDGLVDQTWTDAWAYYFGASYNVNSSNRVELYAIGAPQRHGQNLYRQNIAVYDREFAEDLDTYDPAAFETYNEAGRRFNQNWAPVSTSYAGQQAVEDSRFDRQSDDVIMERENFYHKPQVNLNWYSRFTDKASLYNVFYFSGGEGGGTGTYGSLVRQPFVQGQAWFASAPWSWDWDATIERNAASSEGSLGILRNSRNNQYTWGAISKFQYKMTDQLKTTVGIDWRTAEIEHYREVRDLLGGSFFNPALQGDPVSDFWSDAEMERGLGDRIDYDFTNDVDWFGFFGQAEYQSGPLNAYGMAGFSTIKYTYTNDFTADANGNPIVTESDNIGGYQFKAGAGYNINPDFQVYANGGVISKVPIFDNVIDDFNGILTTDPQNEQFLSFEAGVNTRTLDGQLTLKANVYQTTWNDRSNTIGINNPDGTREIIALRGLDAVHRGVEFEAAFQANRFFRFDGAASVGNWQHTDDALGNYRTLDNDGNVIDKEDIYTINDLKVGDAPQTQFALAASAFPMRGLMLQGLVRYYANHYADWDPTSRVFDSTIPESSPDYRAPDYTQSWKAPNYNVVDFHAYYDLPLNMNNVKLRVVGHIFNVFDATYIQDALDNSRFNSFDGDHDADDAEVYFGLPRYFNAGLEVNF